MNRNGFLLNLSYSNLFHFILGVKGGRAGMGGREESCVGGREGAGLRNHVSLAGLQRAGGTGCSR